MQKKLVTVLFIIAILVVFSYGTLVGHYEIFPFEFLKNTKNIFSDSPVSTIDPDQYIFEIDIQSLIQISNKEDIFSKRNNLIDYIWSENGFPHSKMPSGIQNNIIDDRYNDVNNLKKIDKITISMEYGVNSIAYLFHADQSNNNLIIYHQGHRDDFIRGKDTIQFFLDNEISVLAFSMPLLGMNNQPIVDLPQLGKIKLVSHKYLELLEAPQFSPIKFFVEPIIISLNYLDENYDFNNYYMVGISGGGWTTLLSTSIDQRILQGYSVAGSIPFFLRSNPDNFGDYEQVQHDLYNIANYLELYVLASYGDDRKFVKILNKYDPCCFSGEMPVTFDNEVKMVLSSLEKGNFEFHIDDTHKLHEISEYALQIFLNSMKE